MGKSGIIYIMTTSVKGLIKIGKTDNFKEEIPNLEQNGYWNVSGLKPFYAVRVKDCDIKEELLHTIFSQSRVADSELFALDENVVKQLLETFEVEQIYPESELTFEKLGIPVGAELTFVKDENIKAKTVDFYSTVVYQGDMYSLSTLAKHLCGHTVQGEMFFTYRGETLNNMRKRLGV